MATEKRGSIAFFATYRPPVPLDIYSCPNPSKPNQKASLMTDGKSYNYNGQVIPANALKVIIKRPKLASEGFREADVNAGRLTGMLFVSERGNLEILHFGFRYAGQMLKIFSFADVYDTYKGVRLEDSGCIAGDHVIYITTKDQAVKRREPWTAVYRTNLKTAATDRMTPRVFSEELGPLFFPKPTTAVTKRRLYCMRLWALPLGFFFLSCFATFGVCPLAYPHVPMIRELFPL